MSGTKEIPPWYFGKVSQEDAHLRLGASMSGTYLLRESMTSRGSYVISINENGAVVDYDVRKAGGKLKINDRDFVDLQALIGYYQKYPLDTITLDTPCPKEGMPSPPISPSWHK